MKYGTVILMRNEDSFITQAMLSSYISVTSKDYLELLFPFLLKCLPDEKDAIIDISQLQKQMNDQYQLDILYNVVEKMLQRACKKKKGAYVQRSNKVYRVNNVYDSTEFDLRKEKIKSSINSVIDKLQKYLTEEKRLSGITKENAGRFLADFLDMYNYSVYEDADSVGVINAQGEKDKSNYYVAQFILNEHKNETSEFDYILELVKGTLAAKSIYFFMNSENEIEHKNIQKTQFILDTRLLIELLGLNLEQERNAMLELTSIIQTNGGKLVTFPHYIEEVQGIINRYVKSPEIRLSLSLAAFVKNRYSSVDADAYMYTIESRLEELGVTVIEKPDYSENVVSQNWHIDYAELRSKLSSSIDYKKTADENFSDALIHDADTIEAVAYQRGSAKKCDIFNCKSIFVTKNRDIGNVVYDLYRDERFSKGEINFAITDVDLTSMIWLATFGTNTDLPKLKLLENAYVACAPSKQVMKAFLSKMSQMSGSAKISQEMAVILRTRHASMGDLVELTGNDASKVTSSVIAEMESRETNRIRKEIRVEVSNEYKDKKQQFDNTEQRLECKEQQLEEVEESLEAKREELIELQKNVMKGKHDVIKGKRDNAYVKARQEIQKQKFSEEREIREKEKAEISKVRAGIVSRAEKKGNLARKRARVLLHCITTAIAVGIVVGFSYGTFRLMDTSSADRVNTYVAVGIVSIVGTAMSVFSIWKWGVEKIIKLSEKAYDHYYCKAIDEFHGLFE